jgi:hypothetical protein
MTCCTTLNRVRAKGLYEDGWKKLLKHLGKTSADDEPLPLSVIVESNGLEDALWCCRSVDYDRVWRLYAVWCARQVQHLMKDAPSIAALDVAQDYAIGLATRDALERAESAARAAARAASRDADAAWAAAWAAARAASRDADAAWAAAWAADAAGAATRAASRDMQKAMFLRVVNASTEDAAAQILLDAMPKRVMEDAAPNAEPKGKL